MVKMTEYAAMLAPPSIEASKSHLHTFNSSEAGADWRTGWVVWSGLMSGLEYDLTVTSQHITQPTRG